MTGFGVLIGIRGSFYGRVMYNAGYQHIDVFLLIYAFTDWWFMYFLCSSISETFAFAYTKRDEASVSQSLLRN